jgi:hypothetical protein
MKNQALPKNNTPYIAVQQIIPLGDFWCFETNYCLRSNYFRVKQWTTEQKQSFIDNVFRQIPLPSVITLRKINKQSLPNNNNVFEILDGWQRITAIKDFINGKIQLPQSLENHQIFCNSVPYNIDGSPSRCSGWYGKFPKELKILIQEKLTLNANIIIGIDDTNNVEYEKLASEMFLYLHPDEDY